MEPGCKSFQTTQKEIVFQSLYFVQDILEMERLLIRAKFRMEILSEMLKSETQPKALSK